MAVNVMANDFARRNMWDSEYRPEQRFARDFLAKLHPEWTIKLELPVNKLTVDGKPAKNCVLDIAVTSHKIAVRLNGGYHHASSRQQTKDEFQKEALIQAGWKVLDFDSYMMPNLFKNKKNEETVKLAEEEILKQLGDL
jgi:very-short-patch-repair endonuclease